MTQRTRSTTNSCRGEPTDWYTVKGEIWMRDGARREPDLAFGDEDRKLSYQWLEQRLWTRCRTLW